MPDRYQESHIRQIPMFSQLSDYQFQLVARSFEARSYNPGDRVLIQGTEVPGIVVVANGQLQRVHVSPDGKASAHGAILEGQAIYERALFEPVSAETFLQAVMPTTVLLLTRASMGNLLSHHPDLKVAFGLQQSQTHYLHDVHFKTQRENEKVLLRTRRHWFAMMRWMWAPVFVIIFGLMIAAAMPRIAFVTVPAVFIFGVAGIIYIVLEWANDSVIVTDQRVIRIIHTILTFHEVRDEVALESIQEANAEIPRFDMFALIFRYGDVELKTAGAEGNFVLDFMPDPEKLQDLILEDARNFKAKNQGRHRDAMKAEVERWIEKPYAPGQNPYPQNTQAEGASASKIKDIYSPGDGPLSPFVMSFPTKDGGIVYRKHWFIWLRSILVPAIWIGGSLIAMLLLLLTPLGASGLVGWTAAFAAFLFGTVWFYLADWDWRHDYYLISENNITIINQRPLWLQNESDQILLKQVDNVVSETKGFLQQIFKYGDVKVALVGADKHKLFDNVADPLKIQGEITGRQRRLKQREVEDAERAQRETIGEYLSLYHESRQNSQQDVYGQDTPLPYPPAQPQGQGFAQDNPSPSPFGRRPTMSEGRRYVPGNQPPAPRQNQYNPNPAQYPANQQGQYYPANEQRFPQVNQYGQPSQPPQQEQYRQGNQIPQQRPYPQNNQYQQPQQGQYQSPQQQPYQSGNQYGQPSQRPQQGNQVPQQRPYQQNNQYQQPQQGQYQPPQQQPYQPGQRPPQQGQYNPDNQFPQQQQQGQYGQNNQPQNRPPPPPPPIPRPPKFPKNRNG